MWIRSGALTAAILIILLLSGCAVHQDLESVAASNPLPDHFSGGGVQMVPDRWWRAFGDEQLDGLVDTALADNLTLLQAWARLEQARAVARAAGAGVWPTLDADATASRTRSGLESFNVTTRELSKTIDSFSLSATVGYQVDLWKKIDAQQQAEIFAAEASRRDLEATAQAITASVSDTWFALLEQDAAAALYRAQAQVNEEYLRLVELRFSQGLASAVDVFQQRLQLASARNQIPQAQTAQRTLRHQLDILLGRPPALVESPTGELPALPPLPATGVPLEVVRQRPDVRAAELRIFGADKRIAIAIADQFPSLRLTSSSGARSSGISDIFDRWFVNLVGNIVGPLFDGGRREAEVERTRAVLRERLLAWEQTVLTALREVEDALAQEDGQAEILRGVELQIELARKTLAQARSRYLNGLSDYLNVLTSLQNLQRLERTELQSRRQLLANRIRLYVALGGSWAENLEPPSSPEAGRENGD